MSKIFIVVFLLFSFAVFAANEPANKDQITATEKKYSVDEFNSEVKAEVEKTLKKMGHGKMVEFARELMEKDEALKLRELELKKQNEQLTINMKGFESQITNFKDTQKRILGCLDEQDEKKTKRIGHMVDVISGMKPVSAAQVLSVQDPEITIEILGKLDAGKVSKIFNLMEKEISARLQKQYMTMKK